MVAKSLEPKVIETILKALNRGNLAEVKIEHGKAVVIEVQRKKVNIV